MYKFFLKYKQVIINIVILVSLILITIDFGRDFFLGAASGAVLINLGESIGYLKRTNKPDKLNDEKIFQ